MTKGRKEPWEPCSYEYHDVVAMKALASGTATPDQQTRALKWIVETAAGLYEEHYFSGEGGDRNTAYDLGKAYVGRSIVKLVNMPAALMDQLRKKKEEKNVGRNTEQG